MSEWSEETTNIISLLLSPCHAILPLSYSVRTNVQRQVSIYTLSATMFKKMFRLPLSEEKGGVGRRAYLNTG